MSLNKIDHEKIAWKAYEVLEASNIKDPVVNVIKIAQAEGIKIREAEMPKGNEKVAGFYDKNSKTIFIAKNDSPERKLFSVAHELGHLFLGHKHATVLYRTVLSEGGQYPTEESEANSFAAHLLMPDYMVKEYMERLDLAKSDYKTLAKIFGVPISAMLHTLTYLS